MRILHGQEERSERPELRLFGQLLLITLLASTLGILISGFYPDWRWEQIPFHSLVEGVGGITAIAVAFLLPRFLLFSEEMSPFVWVGAALIGMGTLDMFHAVVYPGQQFIWFHSISNFVGGVLFACVWLPERFTPKSKNNVLPIVALIAAFMIGVFSFALPEAIPSMKQNGQFTLSANMLNMLGGAGFILSAAYFVFKFFQQKSIYCSVLANHCFLFGLSGLLFNFSALWDGIWWEWHILRLLAYAFILYFFFISYNNERRRYDEKLSKLSQAVQYNGEPVMITDTQSVIEYINPAFTSLTGYSSEEAIGRTPSILKSDAQDPSCYTELWQTINRGGVWNGSLIEKKKDGTYYPAMVTISPIKNSAGVITHFVSTQKDMTEYQRLDDQFRQSQKLESIGTLAGGIAHDFNNMLAAIDGNIFVAQMNLDDKAKVQERLGNVENLSHHAAEMVKQLLTYARQDVVSMQPMNLNDFMVDANQLAKNLLPENIKFTYKPYHQCLVVNGDTTQLQQMLLNLFTNALHAVRDVQKAAISCSVNYFIASDSFMIDHPDLNAHEFAQITVCDNGYGISKENLQKIVDPFFTTKGVGEGSGLGLSMVSGSIQRHGGVLHIESKEGEGTTCHIYIPLSGEIIGSEELVNREVPSSGNEETILLVDDEKGLLESISSVLRSLNYHVLEANDGKMALHTYEANRDLIDLVITDLVMPKMGGSELMSRIWEKDSSLPAIFVSGYNLGETKVPSDKEMQTVTLNKPFSINKICQHVRLLLD